MSLIGTTLKPFKAEAYRQGKFETVTDADVKGKWGVFFFYPADFTFVCPTELEDLADKYAELQGLGVEVYSVSTDTHFSHKAWADTSPAIGKIQYYMLGDQNHDLSNNFDILRVGVGLGVLRRRRAVLRQQRQRARRAAPPGRLGDGFGRVRGPLHDAAERSFDGQLQRRPGLPEQGQHIL